MDNNLFVFFLVWWFGEYVLILKTVMGSKSIWKLSDSDLDLLLVDERKANAVKDYMSRYILENETIQKIKHLYERQMQEGLRSAVDLGARNPTILGMKLSFFTEFFDGTEEGSFVVIHITSQHLILTLAEIRPGFAVKTKIKYFTVTEHLRRSPYIMIFEYICDCMLRFFGENNLLNQTQIVGFCTDLPMVQQAIDEGIVSYFTNSARAFPLNCYDVTRCFEIVLLKERYRDIRIQIVCVVTDHVSEFVNAIYTAGDIDIFLGECGLAYMEGIYKVGKWSSPPSYEGDVLIDTELKTFGLDGCLDFLCTAQDWLTLSTPLNLLGTVNKHACLETFLSERYVMELIKHILVDLNHELLYCRSAEMGSLQEKGISLTDICAIVDNENDPEHSSVLLPGGTVGGSEEDAKVAIYVIKVILLRVALLLAIPISSVMTRCQNKDDFVIVAKNSLLRYYRDCETYLRNFVTKLAPGKKFRLLWASEDSSVVKGAALATAIANRLDRSKLRY